MIAVGTYILVYATLGPFPGPAFMNFLRSLLTSEFIVRQNGSQAALARGEFSALGFTTHA